MPKKSYEIDALRLRITELEVKLAKTNPSSLLRSMFDDMFEGIQIFDANFRYVYLNKTAAAHGRNSREDLIGRTLGEVFPGIEQTEVYAVMLRCQSERSAYHMINYFTYPDGQSAWFDLRMNPVPLGLLVLSVDISEQKAIEEQLRQSREDLATTLDCMPDGVVTTDMRGQVTHINPAAERLTGWSEIEAKGRLLEDLVGFLDHGSESPVEHVVDQVLREGSKVGLANHTLLVARDGSRVPIASSGAPIRDRAGSVQGVVLVLRNMKKEYDLNHLLQQSQKMLALD